MDFHHKQPVSFEKAHTIVNHIHDGDTVAIGGFWFVRLPIALVDALVKKGVRNLTIITQASGLALEQLISTGLVKKVIFSFASLDIFGLPPFFRKAIENGQIEWEEWTALRMNQALEAGKQNLPSFVMQAPWGSDFMEESEDFCISTCPLTGKPLGVMRSIQPDVALIHAQRADQKGNIQLQGSLGIDQLLIGASKQTFVSVEEIVPEGKFEPDPRSTIIPHFLLNRITHIPGGAYPTSCLPYYITDFWHLSEVIPKAKLEGSYHSIQQPEGESLQERIGKLQQFSQIDVEVAIEKIKNKKGDFSSTSYTMDELMACVLAEEMKDHMVTTVGSNTPLSLVAYLLAKKTHAPNIVIIPFTGLNDISVYPITVSLAEVFAFNQSTSHWAIEDLWQWIYQKSLTSIEFGSPAQLDQSGRINLSIIGQPGQIKVRLPGQAGLADVLNLHQHCYLYLTRQSESRLVESVDWSSGARHFLTNEERKEAGLPEGQYKVFTNYGIFKLDHKTRKLTLTHIHPGVSLEEVSQNTGFPLYVAKDLITTPIPTEEQLSLIRNEIDPLGFRKIEFASGKERNELIKYMLDKEQEILFGEKLLSFRREESRK
jgi:glutaconate CoA-transferase subunit A